MNRWLRAFGVWALAPAVKPVLRDFIAVWFLLLQGAIRTIDGLLFTVLPTRILPSDIYGIAQIVLGIWLLATRSSHARGALRGQVAAALAAGLFITLGIDLWPINATSALPALGVALALAAETRYDTTA